MYAEVAWVIVSSGTQVQPQIIRDADYLPDYFFVSYGYDLSIVTGCKVNAGCTGWSRLVEIVWNQLSF